MSDHNSSPIVRGDHTWQVPTTDLDELRSDVDDLGTYVDYLADTILYLLQHHHGSYANLLRDKVSDLRNR